MFEHPLNERIRTLMRLEHLFSNLGYFNEIDDKRATRSAIDALQNLISVTGRSDIKKELLNELERQAGNLRRMRNQQGVDSTTLNEVLEQLDRAAGDIHRLNGPIGQLLRENEFLTSIQQRSSIPGGSCSFDLPNFHFFLEQPFEARRAQMKTWEQELGAVQIAVGLMLSLIRDSGVPSKATAEGGLFQGSVDSQTPIQMIRIHIPKSVCCYPEISGHKNRYTIRFMQVVNHDKAQQAEEDIAFSLTRCVL